MKFLNLSRIVSLPGKNLFGIVISGVNKLGIYVALTKLLAKYNVSPLILLLLVEMVKSK